MLIMIDDRKVLLIQLSRLLFRASNFSLIVEKLTGGEGVRLSFLVCDLNLYFHLQMTRKTSAEITALHFFKRYFKKEQGFRLQVFQKKVTDVYINLLGSIPIYQRRLPAWSESLSISRTMASTEEECARQKNSLHRT